MIPAFRRVRTERTKCGGGGICGERQIRRTFFVTETDRFRGQEEEEDDDEKKDPSRIFPRNLFDLGTLSSTRSACNFSSPLING